MDFGNGLLKWLFRLPLISCAGQLVEEEEEEQLNFDEEVQGWVEIKYDMTQDEKCISGMEFMMFFKIIESCFPAEDGKRNGTFDASSIDSVLDSVNALEEMKDLY